MSVFMCKHKDIQQQFYLEISFTMSFQEAADCMKKSEGQGAKMTNDELLQVYSLYKQGTVGDNNTERPGMLDLKGKAKWDAWTKQKGKSKEQTQQEYINVATTLFKKYNIKNKFNP